MPSPEKDESGASLERIEKVGFFHFPQNPREPLAELQKALEAKGRACVRKSLIVLPEGFNIGKLYNDPGTAHTDRCIVQRLRLLAGEFNVTFGAGLIVKQPCGPSPPFNSFFLVAKDQRALVICRKRTDESPNYTPTARCDLHNPVRFRNCLIGALICVDARGTGQSQYDDRTRHNKLFDRMLRHSRETTHLCSPKVTHQNRCSAGRFGLPRHAAGAAG